MKARSETGIVCTPDKRATEAAQEILRAGGTAIDAATTAGAVLSVVCPHMCGIGGDALWLLSDGRRVDTLLGLGQAGKKRPLAGEIKLRGPASAATTAGAMRAWSLAHSWSNKKWGSRMKLQDLLGPAIELAKHGYAISANQAFWQHQRQELIQQLPDLKALCCDAEDNLLLAGALKRLPQLATTLEHLARVGLEDFYEGELATALAEGFEDLGNGLTREDLTVTQAWHSQPLSIRYRNGTLYNFPPPTQGIYTLSALNTLNNCPISSIQNGSADYFHYLIEAIKAQLKQRNRFLCDPFWENINVQQILSSQQGSSDFADIALATASDWHEEGKPADTVWLAVTDSSGRTACLMQSLFHDFGSGCMVGDSGVLWLNRAAGFHPNPDHANAWAPGKRPAHTLNPSAYLADNGEQYYFGTQGGDGQPQTQMVLATQLIDYGQPVDSALTAPRFLLGRSFFGSQDNLKIERSIPEPIGDELARRGHDIEWIPIQSPFTGLAGAISIQPNGSKEAMHDPRGEGSALAQ